MSNLLNQTAVGRKDGEEAKELFGHYLQTRPGMALNHAGPAAQQAPSGSGSMDPLKIG